MVICGVYKITSPSGRVYIGKSTDILKRWVKQYQQPSHKLHCKSQPKLYNSLLKYGWEAHSFEVLEICDNGLLDDKEKFYISLYNTRNGKVGMNCTIGGEGTKGLKWTKVSKKRASESKRKMYDEGYVSPLIGTSFSEERKKKMSEYMTGLWVGEKNPFYGKSHTEEAKKIIGQKSIGRVFSEEVRQKASERFSGKNNPMYGIRLSGEKNGMYGKNHTEESKAKMKRKLSSEQIEKIRNRQLGKKHSEETKLKIIERLIGNKYALGYKNTPETINKRRLANIGRKHSEEAKKNMSIAQKGLKKSNEFRLKLSITKSKLVVNIHTGIFYQSSEEAWKAYGSKSLSCFRHKLVGRIKNDTLYRYA